MKLKENDIIRLIFIIFIIIGFIVLIWNFNTTIIEGLTSMSNDCNDCRISPNYSPTATTFSKVIQNANEQIAYNMTTNPQYSFSGDQLLNNYFGSALQGNSCINLDLSGNQLQVSTMSLIDNVAYNIPQLVYDNLNLKLREKTD